MPKTSAFGGRGHIPLPHPPPMASKAGHAQLRSGLLLVYQLSTPLTKILATPLIPEAPKTLRIEISTVYSSLHEKSSESQQKTCKVHGQPQECIFQGFQSIVQLRHLG